MGEFPAIVGAIPVVFFETIGSTNAEALTRIQQGEKGPKFFAAGSQSAGRGRRGRPWVSEAGNLHATLLLTDPSLAAVSAQLCFVAALALHDAVLDSCPALAPTRLRLKWPNDLLLDGAKAAGILIEGLALDAGRIATAVGFGVNCKHHPTDTPFPAIDFKLAGFDLAPEILLERLGVRWSIREKEWARGEGFAAIREAWLLRAAGIGESMEVRLPDRNLTGTFESLNGNGALILRTGDGLCETISAGDVFPIAARAG